MKGPVTPPPAKDTPVVPDSPQGLLSNGMLKDTIYVTDGSPGLALNIGKR
jgi:hypothetical protein